MAHYHAATPNPFAHLVPGDNGACRCAAHAGPGLPRADACTYACSMCERTALLAARIAARNDGRPLPGEEQELKARKRDASIKAGGCGCGSYGPRALKAFATGVR